MSMSVIRSLRRGGAGAGFGGMSAGRIRAVFRKELRDFRRNRFIVGTMAVVPLVFMVLPTVELLTMPAGLPTSALDTRIGLAMLYLLIVPAMVPAAISAYSVIGERDQGTLEPVLTTPIRAEEFLVGKALAALLPTLFISYTMFGVFLGCAELFAQPAVATAALRGPQLLAQLLFTPLVAGWSIWVVIAISARVSDVRVAQQLGTLASLPPLAVSSLMSFNVIHPTLRLAVTLAAVLLVVDSLGWRAVAAVFDRERLITGSRALR
ncbi:ABC transporter permease subunit [Streptacidiphilus carbonis]|uniref:ABC transporter permease subunit n=1 Tax=Streptacidiphilus carbonis TaxID=105422 RepID=UPI000A038529|nr:ABC transporter permease subunit [Streptacidiphilus carbonis]